MGGGLGRALGRVLVPLVLALLWPTVGSGHQNGPSEQGDVRSPVRRVVLMIGDGMGPAEVTLGRLFAGEPLVLDEMLVGSISTAASNAVVTDSAAAATALASGVKTYVGAVGVDPRGRPVGTLLEASVQAGLAVGLVTTTEVSHATPAAFAAHVRSRIQYEDIVEQYVGQSMDVLFGGGRDWWLPAVGGGVREDGRDMLAEARAAGATVTTDPAAFREADATPLVALFGPGHMRYEIDRDDDEEPSLAEMTARALELLSDDPDGFFLMVEGGRIDHAGHENDAPTLAREVLAFDAAVGVARDFAERDGRTLVVVTADHETGGLSVGRDGPGRTFRSPDMAVLAAADVSLSRGLDLLDQGLDPEELLTERLGIQDVSVRELEALRLAFAGGSRGAMRAVLVPMVSERAGVGWTTLSHTAVDVGVWAVGPGADALGGHMANEELGLRLAGLMRLDLASLTEQLRSGS